MKTLCIAAAVAALATTTPVLAQTAANSTVSGVTPVVGTKSHGDIAGNTGTTGTGSGKDTGSAAAAGSIGGNASTISKGSTSVSGSGTMPAKASLSGSGKSVKRVPNNGKTVRKVDSSTGSQGSSAPTAVPGSTNSVSPAAR